MRRKEVDRLLLMPKQELVNELVSIITKKDSVKNKFHNALTLLLKSNILGALLGWFLTYVQSFL